LATRNKLAPVDDPQAVPIESFPLPAEHDELEWFDQFDFAYIFSHQFTSIDYISSSILPTFGRALNSLLIRLASNVNDLRAWKAFFFFPFLTLYAKHSNSKGQHEVISYINFFIRGEFDHLHQNACQLELQRRDKQRVERQAEQIEEALIKSVVGAAKKGEYGKALQSLLPESFPKPIDAAVRQKLETLHPARSPPHLKGDAPVDRAVPLLPGLLEFSYQEMHNLISKCLPRGKAQDSTGWRNEFFSAIASTIAAPPLFELIASIVRNGKLPPELRPFFAGGRLSALGYTAKPDKVRPIAIGSIMRTVACRAANLKLVPTLAQYLPPHQQGVAIPGGTESIIFSTRTMLNADTSKPCAIWQNDAVNAFNTVSREYMEEEIEDKFPAILPIFKLLYGADCQGQLRIYRADLKTFEFIPSREGSQQGDPLAGNFFAIAVQPAYVAVAKKHPDVILDAFFDDVQLRGPPDKVLAAVPDLHHELRIRGLISHVGKSVWFSRSSCDISPP
jgi:hypothetical protein